MINYLIKNSLFNYIVTIILTITFISCSSYYQDRTTLEYSSTVADEIILLNFNTFIDGMTFKINNISPYLLSNPTITLSCTNDISYLSRSYDIGSIKHNSFKKFKSDIIYNNCNTLRLDYIFIPITRSRYFDSYDPLFNPYNNINRSIQGVIFIKDSTQ